VPIAPLRPCVVYPCPALIQRGQSRCPEHARQADQQRGSSTQRGYGTDHRRLRAEAIKRQPWCGRCGHTGSADNPLSADHVQPKSRGGASEAGNLQVLCHRCNSGKRDR